MGNIDVKSLITEEVDLKDYERYMGTCVNMVLSLLS